MVLLVPCYSASSLLLATPPALAELPSPFDVSSNGSQDLFYRVPESLRPVYRCEARQQPAEPIPLARNREDSPLSTSTDSIGSWRSTRSAAERQSEREARKHLLNVAVAKLHGARDPPLRKHLHLVKLQIALQRDLELLDDEELLCSLTGDGNDTQMEVDEWPRKHPHHQGQQQSATFDNVQDAFGEPAMTWWHTPATAKPHLSSQHGMSGEASLGVVGSSRDDESFTTTTTTNPSSSSTSTMWGSQLWAHLDDLSANPLGGSWLSTGELSSLFAPHLHAATAGGDALLMQA